MRTIRTLFALSILALAAASLAQSGTSTVAASGGSPAAVPSNSGGEATWTGLSGSASRSTIGYQDPGNPGNTLKFATDPNTGAVSGTSYGFNGASGSGSASSQGQSTVQSPTFGLGAPTYYNAGWGSAANNGNAAGNPTSIGTFDPFDVRLGDISGRGSTVDLYYQTSLLRSFQTATGATYTTGLNPGAGQSASYSYSVYYVLPSGTRASILTIGFSSLTGAPTFSLPGAQGISLYLLDPTTANDPNLSPDSRANQGTQLNASNVGTLSAYFNRNGSLTRNLDFGVFYRNFAVPSTGSSNDLLLSWHTDTLGAVSPQAVPEPGALAALGLGGLALLRRRRR